MSDEKPSPEVNPVVEAQLEVLRGNEGAHVLDEMSKAVISRHPEYASFKDSDHCPEGILRDLQDGSVYIQKVCRCTDGEVRALRAVFDEKTDGYEKYYEVRFDSKAFSKDFPL